MRRVALAYAGVAGILDSAFLIGAVSAYALRLGAEEGLAAFAAGAYSVAALPASLLAALAVERLGLRRSLVLGLAWDSASVYSYSLASTPWELVGLRMIHAIGGSLVYPAYLALASSGGGGMGRRVGFYLGVVGGVVGVGALAGAAVLSLLGFRGLFTVLSLLILAGALAVAFGVEEPRAGVVEVGLLEALRDERLAWGLLVIFLQYLGFGLLVGGLSPALLAEGIATSEREAGAAANAAIGVSALVGALVLPAAGAAADAGKLAHVAIASAAVGAAGLAATPASPGAAALLAPFAAYGVAVGGLMLVSSYLVLQARRRAAAAAVQQVANILGVAVGAPAAGALAAGGPEPLSAAAALATLAAGAAGAVGATRASRAAGAAQLPGH